MTVQISVSANVDAPLARVFDTAASIDPRALIRKHGPLPAIVDTDANGAPWSAIGQVRRHSLSDHSSVREELTAFAHASTFSYRLTDFTGAVAPLLREARADWHFTQSAWGRTRIDWTYVFTATGPLAEPFLWFVVKLFWPGYLHEALARVKEKAEAGSP